MSLSDVVGGLVVAVEGTAAEILHHLLLTKQRGKSPIRLGKLEVAFWRTFDGCGDAQGHPGAPPPLPRGLVFAHSLLLLLRPLCSFG